MFRGNSGQQDHFDLNVYDTVLSVMRKQEWLEDYLSENEIDTCEFVGISNINVPIQTSVSLLRLHLELDARWAFGLANTEERDIDRLVYDLCGLTQDKIAIVEGTN